MRPSTPSQTTSPNHPHANSMDISPSRAHITSTVPITAPVAANTDSTPALFTSEQVSAAVSHGIAEALNRLEERDQFRSAVNGTSERPSLPCVYDTFLPPHACHVHSYLRRTSVYLTPSAVIQNVPTVVRVYLTLYSCFNISSYRTRYAIIS